MKEKVRQVKRDYAAQPLRPEISTQHPGKPQCVRRPSGTFIILGLVLGTLTVQGAMLGYLHWDESRTRMAGDSQVLWEASWELQPVGKPAQGAWVTGGNEAAFYPPPGWDNGLFSRTSDGVKARYEADSPYTLDALFGFLHQLGGRVPPHEKDHLHADLTPRRPGGGVIPGGNQTASRIP